MASDLRKKWQDFKHKHPDFEKSKNFKSDVGPQLDKFDKCREAYTTAKYALISKCDEAFKAGKSVGAALKGYEAIVRQLKDSDKTIAKDFADLNFGTFESTYVDQYDPKTIEDHI